MTTVRGQNTGIVPPHIRDRIEANAREAQKLQATLVDVNKKGRVGTRTITFQMGRKTINTAQAMKALSEGKTVKATVVEFKTARTSKLVSGGYYKAKVRVRGIGIETFKDTASLATWAKQHVIAHNAQVARAGA